MNKINMDWSRKKISDCRIKNNGKFYLSTHDKRNVPVKANLREILIDRTQNNDNLTEIDERTC